MNDYLISLEAILLWYGVVGTILYVLTAIGRLKIEMPITRVRFFVLWLLCLLLTSAPLLFSSLNGVFSQAAYNILLLVGSLAAWTLAKCLLLIIILKRALICHRGKFLFVACLLFLLFAESIHVLFFPAFVALSVLWMFVPIRTAQDSSLTSAYEQKEKGIACHEISVSSDSSSVL